MVRLKVRNLKRGLSGMTNFNSKMVRLIVVLLTRLRFTNKFQFQDGAVKRRRGKPTNYQKDQFQFQDGAVKRVLYRKNGRLITDFNSKMVRLKANHRYTSYIEQDNFNSKMVRLKDENGYNMPIYPSEFQFQDGAVKR